MCDELKRQFYAACPVWYWPVLWWQFVVMERTLAGLYAARGRTRMTYGLSLGPRGQLRLIFLSDATQRSAAPWQGSLAPFALACAEVQARPFPDDPFWNLSPGDTCAPMRPALTPSPFYLDPG